MEDSKVITILTLLSKAKMTQDSAHIMTASLEKRPQKYEIMKNFLEKKIENNETVTMEEYYKLLKKND